MTDFETNAEKLPWPQDISGITAKLRREGCRSIGRMKGNDHAMEVVMGTLRVLAKHAEAKLAQQKKHTINQIAAHTQRTVDAAAVRLGDRTLKLANIRKEMEHLQRQKAALVAIGGITPAPVHKVAQITKAPKPPVQGPPEKTNTDKAKALTTAASKAGLGAPQRVS